MATLEEDRIHFDFGGQAQLEKKDQFLDRERRFLKGVAAIGLKLVACFANYSQRWYWLGLIPELQQ